MTTLSPLNRLRIAIALPGVALASYGIYRIYTQVPQHQLMILVFWLIGAVVIHDGLLSPAVIVVSWVLARVIPPRARTYVQYALIAGALITVVALPLIHEEGKQPSVKAILRQDFTANLTVLLAIVAVASLVLYAVRVARDRREAEPPSEDQSVAGGTSSGS